MKNAIIQKFVLVWTVVVLTAVASARTVYVDPNGTGDYPTIQAAIDAAVDGDTVILRPGTYTGDGNRDIDFLGKAITVRGVNPAGSNVVQHTIIDCNGSRAESHRGFNFHSDERLESVLAGITITNSYSGHDGGAIYINQSSPTILNCNVINNFSYENCGGIYCQSSSPAIINCNISLNLTDGRGGGIACVDSNATLLNCIIKGNRSRGCVSGGGGIYCNSSDILIKECTITDNEARHRAGGAIWCYDSNCMITQCLISDNNSVEDGGAIYFGKSILVITNCTINNNISRGGNGGGIYGGNELTVTDSIINGNSAYNCYSSGGGIYCGGRLTITGSTINNNWSDSKAGGIFCKNDLVVANCKIEGNHSGGIYCEGSLTISSSTVNSNSSDWYGGVCCGGNSKITDCTINDNIGGGIYCGGNGIIINNCTISNNSAVSSNGGGVCSMRGGLTVKYCTIKGNSTVYNGGGLYGCNGPVTYCTITGNSARHGGGLADCEGPVTNCTIACNSAEDGGGLADCEGSITNSSIINNSAKDGGGLYRCGGPITNCRVSNNSAMNDGGGLYLCGDPITDSIITGNTATNRGDDFVGLVTNCTIVGNSVGRGLTRGNFRNCIIWDNKLEIIRARFTYCDIQEGFIGEGNIDVDPCFVNSGYWDPNGTPGDPSDDFWVDGDYRLLPDSPCINAGDPNYIPEPNETDLDGLPRIIGGRIDMGAYEFNHQPVAVAGPNQVAYAFIDRIADVTLDGSASYDEDSDILDYYWSWFIDSNLCEANGVSPTIQLPVGEHQIELIVDDGLDLSEPDYCIITVIGPLRTKLWLWPAVLNCNARTRYVTTLVYLPKSIEPGDVNNQPLIMYPCDIKSKYQRVFRIGRGRYTRTVVMAVFDKDEICDCLGIGRHQVEVAGQLQTGRYFYGTNIIRITRPNHHKWPNRCFHRLQ